MRAGGCPLCSKMIRGSIERKSEIFIKKALYKFGDRFDYSNSIITGLTDNNTFNVRCKKHNIIFTTSAPDHLRFESRRLPRVCKRNSK